MSGPLAVDVRARSSRWHSWALWGAGAAAAGLAAGVVFAYDPHTTAFYPPCPFLTLTGFLCPGCGSTRALHALLHGRIVEAATLNPLLFLIPPLVGAVHWAPRLGLERRSALRLRSLAGWTLLVLVLGFGIVRNLV